MLPGRRAKRALLFQRALVLGDSMGSPDYARGKFLEAIEHMATGPGDVRSRLWDAYLSLRPVMEDDLPPVVRQDFRWIMAQLTKRDPYYNHKGEVISGSVQQSLSRMHNTTGVKIAKRLLHIYRVLEDYVREHGLGHFGLHEPAGLRRRSKGSAKKK